MKWRAPRDRVGAARSRTRSSVARFCSGWMPAFTISASWRVRARAATGRRAAAPASGNRSSRYARIAIDCAIGRAPSSGISTGTCASGFSALERRRRAARCCPGPGSRPAARTRCPSGAARCARATPSWSASSRRGSRRRHDLLLDAAEDVAPGGVAHLDRDRVTHRHERRRRARRRRSVSIARRSTRHDTPRARSAFDTVPLPRMVPAVNARVRAMCAIRSKNEKCISPASGSPTSAPL